MSGQKQTLVLHLFTAPSKMFCGQRLGGHWAQLYYLVFIVTPSAQRTDLRDVSVGNAIMIAGGYPVNNQEKHVISARQYCGSFLTSGPRTYHCHLQRCWIGSDRTVVWPPRLPDLTPLVFFLWGYKKPWFTHRQLILKRILLPLSLTRHQSSGRVLAFLHANENICFVGRKARHRQ